MISVSRWWAETGSGLAEVFGDLAGDVGDQAPLIRLIV